MKYEDIDCGMRVITKHGPGVVQSYSAEVPGLRALFGDLGKPSPPKATVLLDDGRTCSVAFSRMKKEEEGAA